MRGFLGRLAWPGQGVLGVGGELQAQISKDPKCQAQGLGS